MSTWGWYLVAHTLVAAVLYGLALHSAMRGGEYVGLFTTLATLVAINALMVLALVARS